MTVRNDDELGEREDERRRRKKRALTDELINHERTGRPLSLGEREKPESREKHHRERFMR